MPVPLALASTHRHRSNHRARHVRAVVRSHKRALGATKSRDHSSGTRTLVFHVSRSGGGNATWQAGARHHRIAHLAGDPSDTISDFKFTPASITIHVGDSITWTNNGPTDHTATATDHSFDTGILHKGQSASHTFSQAGTFAYICTLHPFMKGTVVVVGNSSSNSGSNPGGSSSGGSGSGGSGSGGSGSGPSGNTGSTGTGTTATPSSAASLPNTGLDLGATLGTALMLLGLGTALGRRARTQR